MTSGVDYAWSHPSVSSLTAGGYRFACRYLSRDPSKNLTRAEADALHAAGIATVSNWEYATDAALKGSPQGTQDARDAATQHAACGGPSDRPIYFSLDVDPRTFTAAQWVAVEAYYQAIASVVGIQRTGAYGGYALIKRLLDKGLVRWAWQTYAWSGGQWDPRAQVRQVQNSVTIGGADCDIDQATTVDYGQWGVGMDLSDKVPGTDNNGRTVGDVLGDLANLRNWLITPLGKTTFGPAVPLAGSPLDLLATLAKAPAAQLAISDAQVQQLAAAVAAAHPVLGEADEPAIEAALRNVLHGA